MDLNEQQNAISLPNEIEGIVWSPYYLWPYVFWTIVLLLLIVLVYWIFAKYLRPKSKEKQLSPYELCVSSLSAIRVHQDLNRFEVQEIYFELTKILRELLDIFYNVKTKEMTVNETEKTILSHPEISQHPRSYDWIQFLVKADMVKFAGESAAYNMTEEALKLIKFTAAELDPNKLKEQAKK